MSDDDLACMFGMFAKLQRRGKNEILSYVENKQLYFCFHISD